MLQTQIIKLNCQSCESSLNISQDMENFACGHCGTAQIVERKGGIVQLKKVTDAIGKVQRGTDKTAAELALNRLPQELHVNKQLRSVRLKQLKRDYDSSWNLQLTAVVVTALVFLIIATFVFEAILFSLTKSQNSGSIAFLIGFGFAFAGGWFLFKYFSDNDFFSLKKVIANGQEDIETYDKKIQFLEKKIKENYEIANS